MVAIISHKEVKTIISDLHDLFQIAAFVITKQVLVTCRF